MSAPASQQQPPIPPGSTSGSPTGTPGEEELKPMASLTDMGLRMRRKRPIDLDRGVTAEATVVSVADVVEEMRPEPMTARMASPGPERIVEAEAIVLEPIPLDPRQRQGTVIDDISALDSAIRSAEQGQHPLRRKLREGGGPAFGHARSRAARDAETVVSADHARHIDDAQVDEPATPGSRIRSFAIVVATAILVAGAGSFLLAGQGAGITRFIARLIGGTPG